jgi:hypothetical protein
MAEGTRVRDWARVDYYAALGVRPDATDAEIARAFRALAKQLHPDSGADTVEAERFKQAVDAYQVLSEPATRHDYDEYRASLLGGYSYEYRHGAPPTRVPTARFKTGRPHKTEFTRRRAWFALAGGIAVVLLGVAVAWLTFDLHRRDAQRRADGVAVVAQRLDTEAGRFLEYRTLDGQTIRIREPRTDMGQSGPTMKLRYDPDDPESVVVDESTFGRDVTLAIVAVKLLLGGIVFAVMGGRRLHALAGAERGMRRSRPSEGARSTHRLRAAR